MLQNQNKVHQIRISEFQKFLADLMPVYQILDHGIILRSVNVLGYPKTLPFKTVREPFDSYGSSISLASFTTMYLIMTMAMY
jgi:hypothetical protein